MSGLGEPCTQTSHTNRISFKDWILALIYITGHLLTVPDADHNFMTQPDVRRHRKLVGRGDESKATPEEAAYNRQRV